MTTLWFSDRLKQFSNVETVLIVNIILYAFSNVSIFSAQIQHELSGATSLKEVQVEDVYQYRMRVYYS